MINFKDILRINFTEIYLPNKRKSLSFKGISIDTRTLSKGYIYFAIRGEKNDGHVFIHDAIKKGASAVVVDGKFFKAAQKHPGLIEGTLSVPMIVVDDSVKALGELANIYRNKFHIPVIAVAGSNGKTTTKDMIATVLSEKYNVLATEGNLNNQIGVPLTIFRMKKKHNIAVVEIGTNHFGEIEYLCNVLEPTHGVITNIGNEHLQFLKNIHGVTKEEGALFEYLAKGNGKKVAFINADDKIILGMSQKIKNKVKYAVANRNSEIHALNERANGSGKFKFEIRSKANSEKFSVSLSVSGRHNMVNAIAASAVGLNFRVPPKSIQKALKAFKPSGKRMEVTTDGKVTVINDTYNANLDSMLFALETLKSIKSSSKKIIVFADMLELGKISKNHHTLIGEAISDISKEEKQKIILITFGKMAQYIFKAADVVEKFYYTDKNLLTKKLLNIVSKNDIVLVKGSRGMKMEEVVESLIKRLRG